MSIIYGVVLFAVSCVGLILHGRLDKAKRDAEFYKDIAERQMRWCEKNGIELPTMWITAFGQEYP